MERVTYAVRRSNGVLSSESPEENLSPVLARSSRMDIRISAD